MRKISSFALLVAGLLISANSWAVTQVATDTELQTALANGGEILLTQDLNLVQGKIGGYTINNKTVVLDLGGHTITAEAVVAPGNGRLFTVTGNNSDVTVKNGTLNVKASVPMNQEQTKPTGVGTGYYGAFRAENGTPKFTLENLTLYNYRPNGLTIKIIGAASGRPSATIRNCNFISQWGGGIEAAGGIVVIENCNFNQFGYYDHCSSCINVSSENALGELTVRNSTYDTEGEYAVRVFNSGGIINIESGNFVSSGTNNVVMQIDRKNEDQAVATVNISGGVFSGDIYFTGGGDKTLNITDGNFTNVTTINASAIEGNNVIISGGQYGAGTVVKYKDDAGKTQSTTIENYVTTVQDTPAQWITNPDGTNTVIPYGKSKTDFTNVDSTSLVDVQSNITLDANKTIAQLNVTNNSTLRVSDNVTLNVVGQKGVIIEDGSKVEVAPKGILLVNGKVVNMATGEAAYNALVVESDADGTGCLLISPNVEMLGVDHPAATVQLYTKAKKDGDTYYWQHFAVPTYGAPAHLLPVSGYESTNKTWIKKWEKNDWADITAFSQLSDAFRGYNITNDTEGGAVYKFQGNIIGNGDGDLNFVNGGFNMMGNSYTAPVDMFTMLKRVREKIGVKNVEFTVWVYSAAMKGHEIITEGQLDPTSPTYDPEEEVMRTIAPMQGFIMHLLSGTSANATIDYVEAVWNNPNKVGIPVLAPARKSASSITKAEIVVRCGDASQSVRLYENGQFSDEFENGFDASKLMEKDMFNLYATTATGKQSIVATDNLMGTTLSLATAQAIEYTMSFNNVKNFDYAVLDTETGNVISITEGTEYNFVASANSTADRFQIVDARMMPTNMEKVNAPAGQKGVYTVMGQYVGETAQFDALPVGVYVVDGQRIMK